MNISMVKWSLCLVAFIMMSQAEEVSAQESTRHALIDTVDDRAIKQLISTKADKLLADEKVVQIKKIGDQISRTQTSIKLPRIKTNELTSREMYDSVTPTVLILSKIYKCGRCERWHDRSAGAFVLTATGAIVTNYHVVEAVRDDERALGATTVTGEVYPVRELLAANETDDVAILQLELPDGVRLQPAKIADRAWPGEDAIVISHPVGRFFTLTKGIVSRNAMMHRQNASSKRLFITAGYAKGSSGSPVFNNHGEVIGIVSSTESIYYTESQDEQKNLQMVLRNCVQAQSVFSLIK